MVGFQPLRKILLIQVSAIGESSGLMLALERMLNLDSLSWAK